MDTLFTGSHIIQLAETTSTNTYAMQLLKEGGLTEGTVVKAVHQSGGRGQYGNAWEAEPGKNLTFSLVMHPVFLPALRQFYLSKIASLAVLGMLTEFLPPSQYDILIKWPNDILVNGDKIAGILIENVLGNHGVLQSAVIGIGINVNQVSFEPYKRKAVSLAMLLKKELDTDLVLQRFCKHFEALYLNLRQNKVEAINKQYLLNLYQYQTACRYGHKDGEFSGTLLGVEESGELIVKEEGGARRSFNFKEIEFL